MFVGVCMHTFKFYFSFFLYLFPFSYNNKKINSLKKVWNSVASSPSGHAHSMLWPQNSNKVPCKEF